MADETLEVQDSTIPAEDTPVTEVPDQKPTDQVPKAKLEEALGRATRAEKTLKEKEQRLAKLENPPPEETPAALDDKWKKRMEFTVANKDLSANELSEVISYAEGKGVSYDEAYKSDFVKKGIEGLRAKTNTEQATPLPSTTSVVVETAKELAETKPEEEAGKFSFEAWNQKRGGKQNL